MLYNFPATTGGTTTTYLAIPLDNPAVYSGSASAVTADTVTLSDAAFSAGELSVSGSPYFLRIAGGAQAGRLLRVTANTADTVTLDTSDNSTKTTALTTAGFALSPGDAVQLVPGDTLASLFGDASAGNPLLFVGGTSAFSADTVSIYNKTSGKFDTYFYSTTSGCWRLSTVDASANDVVIYPEAAIGIARRGVRSAATLAVVGEVPVVAPLTKVVGGSRSVYASTRFPVSLTLADLDLANWTKANNAFTADTVQLYNTTTGRFDTYYQRLDATWRKSTDAATDQSGLVLTAGSIVVFFKRASVADAASYLSSPLPYSL